MIQHKKTRSGRKFRSSEKPGTSFQVTHNYGQVGTFTNCTFTTPAPDESKNKPGHDRPMQDGHDRPMQDGHDRPMQDVHDRPMQDVHGLAPYYPDSERMLRVADNLAASKSIDDIGVALMDNLTGSALVALVEKIKEKNFIPVLISFIPNYAGSHTERSIKTALNKIVKNLPVTAETEKNDAGPGC